MSEDKMIPFAPMPQARSIDIYTDPAAFTHMVRVAKMFAMSPLVPDHLKKGGQEQAIANCTICLAMARELDENPIVVMQSIHFVSGKFGWAASYMIARANRSGKFARPITWRISGKGDSLKAVAVGLLHDGTEVTAEVDMRMAKAEGWTKNAKYQSMPEQMLRYRSATFLVRLYCPEVMLGYHTTDEIEDMAAAAGPLRTEPINVTPKAEPEITPEAEPAHEPTPPPQSDDLPGTGAVQEELIAMLTKYMARGNEWPGFLAAAGLNPKSDFTGLSDDQAGRFIDALMAEER